MRSLLALLCGVLSGATTPASAQPSVRDVVEFTHIVQPINHNDDALHEQVSPDGTRAFIVTRKADVASDRNRYEILLLDLRPDSLAAQRAPRPATVFAAAVAHDNDSIEPAVRDVHWHGDGTLVFMARLEGGSFQVYRLDLATRKVVALTHETRAIVSYAASQDLRRLVYAVQVPNPPLREGAHAVVVGHQSVWSVKYGQDDLDVQARVFRYFVADVASPRSPRALGPAFPEGGASAPLVSMSPDGRWALLPRWEPERLAAWSLQYPMVAEVSRTYGRSQQVDPLQYFSTAISYTPRRMTAWRLDDAIEQVVLDAPDDALPAGGQTPPNRLWQGTGASVILAGTHLPLAPDGKTSLASHVVEYWPESARWVDVAMLEDRLGEIRALRDGFLLVDGHTRREFHRQADGGWRESDGGVAAPTLDRAAWTLHVAQGLDQPPDVYADGPSGQATRLTSLNPQFSADTWGTMRPYAWHDVAGRQWNGGLLSGRGMDDHTRYPLLIQTYGFAPDRFYLDGPNVAEGATSAFAGRAFLQDGVLVLAMPWKGEGGARVEGRPAQRAFVDGVRGAVAALAEQGRIDPTRVGIIGFSATGQRVLHLVTFGDVPIRAATLADGDADTLFSMTLTFGKIDTTWGGKEKLNEGLPFGDTLPNWVRNDSALHTDCIGAALRIETYGPWILNNWDVYAMLRRQYKPTEMVVLPGGRHTLGTPGDRMVSLQGNVDWFGYWLADKRRSVALLAEETPDSVAAQYARWDEMATLKRADEARPRCTR